jgi:hypothetical protein
VLPFVEGSKKGIALTNEGVDYTTKIAVRSKKAKVK